jgi:hypothetical protein
LAKLVKWHNKIAESAAEEKRDITKAETVYSKDGTTRRPACRLVLVGRQRRQFSKKCQPAVQGQSTSSPLELRENQLPFLKENALHAKFLKLSRT